MVYYETSYSTVVRSNSVIRLISSPPHFSDFTMAIKNVSLRGLIYCYRDVIYELSLTASVNACVYVVVMLWYCTHCRQYSRRSSVGMILYLAGSS